MTASDPSRVPHRPPLPVRVFDFGTPSYPTRFKELRKSAQLAHLTENFFLCNFQNPKDLFSS